METQSVSQWPHDPLPLATWLTNTGWSAARVLAECDRGLNSVKAHLPEAITQNIDVGTIYPEQLKHVGLVFIFVSHPHPIHALGALDPTASAGTRPVTAYVRNELEYHYTIPRSLGAMTHCLRPDILALVYKTWKHSRNARSLDATIHATCSRQWMLNPYAHTTRYISGALAWCGAAVVETGRRPNADMVIGNTCYNICYKDKALATLIIMRCCEANPRVRSAFSDGPPPFKEMCLSAPSVF